jgi:hypothetical protein
MGFPSVVNAAQAPAVAGDFASHNPRFAVNAGPGALVAGAGGVVVGHFAWSDTAADGGVVNAAAAATPVLGFIAREQQGLITAYLAGASLAVPQGFPVTVFSGGDFWVRNTGAGAVALNAAAFANIADGSVQFAASGATVAGAVQTKWFATSTAGAGELAKISSHALG